MARPIRISVAAAITSALLALFGLGCSTPEGGEPADSGDLVDAALSERALVGTLESVWRGETAFGNACVTFVRRSTGTLYGLVEEDGRCENAARLEDRLGQRVMIASSQLTPPSDRERGALRVAVDDKARYRRVRGLVSEIDGCLFGRRFAALESSSLVKVVSERRLTSASRLTELEAEQLVAAVRESSRDEVMSAAEAFSRVDGSFINKVTLLEPATGRGFVAYQYGRHDNSFGALFANGSIERVAAILSGEIGECSVKPDVCMLGARWSDARESGAFTVVAERELTAQSQLSITEEQQLVAAVNASSHDVADAPAAFAAVRGARVFHVELQHGSGARFIAVELRRDERASGAVFFAGSGERAAVIHEGNLAECRAFAR